MLGVKDSIFTFSMNAKILCLEIAKTFKDLSEEVTLWEVDDLVVLASIMEARLYKALREGGFGHNLIFLDEIVWSARVGADKFVCTHMEFYREDGMIAVWSCLGTKTKPADFLPNKISEDGEVFLARENGGIRRFKR